MTVSWQLSVEQRRALDALLESTTDAQVVRNAMVILSSAQGRSKEWLAENFGCSLGTVVNIRRRYRQRGLAGLQPLPRPGRRSRATTHYRAELRAAALAPPPALGYPFHAWSAPRLARHLEQRTGIRFGDDQIRRLLRQAGLPSRQYHAPRERQRRPAKRQVLTAVPPLESTMLQPTA